MMPARALTIRLKKTPDAPPVLTGIRADGTATWQRSHVAFPVHDLVHYCVESTLGFRDAFFGLIAKGWNLEDFGAPWPRGPLPAEAGTAEAIVGEVWRAFMAREPLSAAELNDRVGAYFAQHGISADRPVTDAELTAIQSRLAELARQWRATAPGGTLELLFPGE
jgi:hypothetical protein